MSRIQTVEPIGWDARANLAFSLLDEPRPISYVMGVTGWGREQTRKVLGFLREAGTAASSGRGRYAVWRRLE